MSAKNSTISNDNTLFDLEELASVQATGDAWAITPEDPATVPVPLQTIIMKVDGPYTARDRKLWNFLIHAVWDELGQAQMHTVSVNRINKVFREAGGEHDSDWIWNSAKRLTRTVAEWECTFGDERILGVAAIFGANLSKPYRQAGNLHFYIPPNLVPIIKQPKRFARLRVHFLLSLSGKYAVTLYEILEGFINRRDHTLDVDLDDLRRWLKVPEGSYSAWKDFRKWVLDPAIKQINADPLGAGFTVDYTPVRQGRFYKRVVFTMKKTDTRQMLEGKIKRGNDLADSAAFRLSPDIEDQAREALRPKGLDFHGVYNEFKEYAKKKGMPRNVDKAFLRFCEQKKTAR